MKPLCVAARTALLIDPDKSVRPCCSYGNFGEHLPGSNGIGRLSKDVSLADITNGPIWQQVTKQLDARKIPSGCTTCMRRERDTGFSLRSTYDTPNWDKGITFLELNTSNLCTLECRHCCSFCSHRWALEFGDPVYKPDGDLLLSTLRNANLTHLERIMFKGGEPLINSDVTVALEYLEEIGRLPQVSVDFVTNGTILDKRHMELLAKAKHVHFTLSVDGVGNVQTYIRHGKSEVENIERFVEAYSALPMSVSFSPLPSIMVYNIFTLPEIAKWWNGVRARLPKAMPISFHHFVVDPAYLSLRALRDETRKKLLAHYEGLDQALYGSVVHNLRLPSGSAELHAKFVAETTKNDKLLGRAVLDAVPELAMEMAQ